LVFRFLEGERMKDADGAWGKAVTVDRKKVAKTAMTLNLNSTLAPFSPGPFPLPFPPSGVVAGREMPLALFTAALEYSLNFIL
jgi:hypothetical protein